MRGQAKKRKRRVDSRQARKIKRIFIFCVLLIFSVYAAVLIFNFVKGRGGDAEEYAAGADGSYETVSMGGMEVIRDFIEPNEYSRPGKELKSVKGIVVHYTANPGADAKANRDYFNNLKYANANRDDPVYASSHFIIGLKGQIVQCIPLGEISYASNSRNKDTISIECCHPDKTGKFNKKTYDSLVRLCAWLCGEYGLEKDDIIRHYDVTGKDCPRYYVKHEKKWNSFKDDVFKATG